MYWNGGHKSKEGCVGHRHSHRHRHEKKRTLDVIWFSNELTIIVHPLHPSVHYHVNILLTPLF